MDNRQKTIPLTGRIDSNNAAAVEQELLAQLGTEREIPVVLDAKDLAYISSAGLRVILHLKKLNPKLSITNVSSEVYEILEMTGFTEMMTVEKAYRVVSVEGCEEIGRGANGTIYRIDQDNVVKVSLHLTLEYGANIPEVSRLVQEKVKSSVENMTGLKVEQVDVVIRVVKESVPEIPGL